tara:strand:- start:4911 stop:5444 length:534 start_codon:yes stop_codon:yes gene_type:complete
MSHFEQEIISSRLILRALSLEDSNLIVSWRNNKEIKDFSFSKEEITLEGHRDWFKKTRNIRLDYLFLELQNLEPIGLVSLQKNKYDDQLRSYELSKYIGNKKYLGKGYALEATEALINYAFTNINVDYVFSVTRSDNKSNIKLNTKLGFKVQGLPDFMDYNESLWTYMRKDNHENKR